MANWLSRLFGSSSPPKPSWAITQDTRRQRFEAGDMALLNVHICTRFEREQKEAATDSLVGDYLEFGVFEGSTFLHAHHRARVQPVLLGIGHRRGRGVVGAVLAPRQLPDHAARLGHSVAREGATEGVGQGVGDVQGSLRVTRHG